jgi:competence CoiA-like predicted nuclease
MNIALDKISGKRIIPQKGMSALCQCCKSEVIAKCGRFKIHHWAHKSVKTCDKWWESETEWHKDWKNQFPADWHEVVIKDNDTGERHIADIFNDNKELVIEFQNSRISVDDLIAREKFYKKMIWLISKNQMEISTSSLESLIQEINQIAKNFILDRINPYIKIPKQIKGELDMFVSEALSKENIGKREIKQFIEMFNNNIDLLFQKRINFGNYDESFEPNKTKKFLIKPLIKKIIEDIKSKMHATDIYYRYKIVKGSKTWNYVSSPLFLDTGDELYLLYPNEIARKVSKEQFVKHYSQIRIETEHNNTIPIQTLSLSSPDTYPNRHHPFHPPQ